MSIYEIIKTDSKYGGLGTNVSAGECIVAHTKGMPANILNSLNRLIAYNHQAVPQNVIAPASLSFYKITIGGIKYSVFSKISPININRRAFYIAHLIIFDKASQPKDSTPIDIITDPNLFVDSWDEPPRLLFPRSEFISVPMSNPAIPRTWGNIAGDPGIVGTLVSQLTGTNVNKRVSVIVSPEIDVLQLIKELTVLVPVSESWNITFNTFYHVHLTNDAVKCNLRFALAGTDIVRNLFNDRTAMFIDTVGNRLPNIDDSEPCVVAARNGKVCIDEKIEKPVVSFESMVGVDSTFSTDEQNNNLNLDDQRTNQGSHHLQLKKSEHVQNRRLRPWETPDAPTKKKTYTPVIFSIVAVMLILLMLGILFPDIFSPKPSKKLVETSPESELMESPPSVTTNHTETIDDKKEEVEDNQPQEAVEKESKTNITPEKIVPKPKPKPQSQVLCFKSRDKVMSSSDATIKIEYPFDGQTNISFYAYDGTKLSISKQSGLSFSQESVSYIFDSKNDSSTIIPQTNGLSFIAGEEETLPLIMHIENGKDKADKIYIIPETRTNFFIRCGIEQNNGGDTMELRLLSQNLTKTLEKFKDSFNAAGKLKWESEIQGDDGKRIELVFNEFKNDTICFKKNKDISNRTEFRNKFKGEYNEDDINKLISSAPNEIFNIKNTAKLRNDLLNKINLYDLGTITKIRDQSLEYKSLQEKINTKAKTANIEIDKLKKDIEGYKPTNESEITLLDKRIKKASSKHKIKLEGDRKVLQKKLKDKEDEVKKLEDERDKESQKIINSSKVHIKKKKSEEILAEITKTIDTNTKTIEEVRKYIVSINEKSGAEFQEFLKIQPREIDKTVPDDMQQEISASINASAEELFRQNKDWFISHLFNEAMIIDIIYNPYDGSQIIILKLKVFENIKTSKSSI